MSADEVIMSAEWGDEIFHRLNQINDGDEDTHIIMIGIRSGAAPTIVSSVHPAQIDEILQWLLDGSAGRRIRKTSFSHLN